MDLVRAYLEAGYTPGARNSNPAAIEAKAAKLDNQPKIQRRIGELTAMAKPAVEKAVIAAAVNYQVNLVERRRYVHDMLAKVSEMATERGDWEDALEALKLIGKDVGMWGADQPETGMRASGRFAARTAEAAAMGAATGISMSAHMLRRIEEARKLEFGGSMVTIEHAATADQDDLAPVAGSAD